MSSFYRGEILQADELNGEFAKAVQRTGDTMAGTLVLAHDPVVAQDAATKRYVDNILGNAASTFLPISGGTLTGPLTLNSDPLTSMQAATKQYVDNETAGVVVSDMPPPGASNGDLWFDSVATQLYIRYDDGNSAAWVVVTNQAVAAPAVAGVSTFNGRAGAVTLNNTDVTTVLPPSSTSPSMDGTGAVGSGTTWARADHVHPSDTTRQTAAQVAAAVAPALNDVGRNLLHNALFTVAQRGVGPWTANTNYTLDRWSIGLVLDVVSISPQTLADADRATIGDEAATTALQNVFTGNAGATACNLIVQQIEDVRRLSGKTVTVSLWAKAASGTPKIGISLDQNFGTGGSPSASVLGNGTAITISTTWARYSATIALASGSGKTLGINGNSSTALGIWFSSGANNATRSGSIGVQSGTIQLWGMQLEIGSVTTPLDYGGSPQQQLAQCQRFYQVGFVQLGGPGTVGVGNQYQYMLPVVMRAVPTVTPGTPLANANAGTPTISITTMAVTLACAPTATAGMLYSNSWLASADL